jgi:hypothetical protein
MPNPNSFGSVLAPLSSLPNWAGKDDLMKNAFIMIKEIKVSS